MSQTMSAFRVFNQTRMSDTFLFGVLAVLIVALVVTAMKVGYLARERYELAREYAQFRDDADRFMGALHSWIENEVERSSKGV